MTRIFLATWLLLLCNVAVFGATLNGELAPMDSAMQTFKEGDLFEGVLRLWPMESPDTSALKALEKKDFLNALYLQEISNIAPSENNADVLEVRGLFIVKSNKLLAPQMIPIGTDMVELRWKGPAIESLKARKNEFYIEAQSPVHKNWWFFAALLLAVGGGMLLVFRKKLKILLSPRPKEVYSTKFFDELFRSANSREEFERIYALREKWLPLLKLKTPAHHDFMKVINQHQYKKHWGQEEINETKSSFEIIRRSFSQ